jgi:hypothetical protein
MEQRRRVTEEDFTAEVPLDWNDRSEPGGYDYLSPTGKEHVAIRVSRFNARQAGDVLRAIAQEAVEARQKAIAEMSKGLGMLVPVKNEPSAGQHIVELVGSDPISRTLMCVRIVVTSMRLVTIGVYRYGDISEPKAFTAWAEPICRSLVVVSDTAVQN